LYSIDHAHVTSFVVQFLISILTAYGAYHRETEASSNVHITNIDGQENDSRDVSSDEPDFIISLEAASKVDSEFRPFLLGGGYC